jgi:hypothetical protein
LTAELRGIFLKECSRPAGNKRAKTCEKLAQPFDDLPRGI